MRYRPFGPEGKAVSAVSLKLVESSAAPNPQAWRALLFGAMECGINCFELAAGSTVLPRGVNEALQAVDRSLLFLSWHIRGHPNRPLGATELSQSLRDGLSQTGAGYFDLVMMDETAIQALTPEGRKLLDDAKAAGLVLHTGVAGEGAVAEACIGKGQVDVVASPFSLLSDGRTRRRVKDAAEASMPVIAYDAIPPELCRAPLSPKKASGLLRRAIDPLAGVGTYNFLHQTRGWTPQELCLGYALTEPAFATVQIDTLSLPAIERLASVVDRDLPTGVVAQIEMARFSPLEAESRRA